MEILQEGRKEFLAWAKVNDNEERAKKLLQDFLDSRSKFPSPENNMDWWVKNKSPLALHAYIANFKSKTAKEKEERKTGAEKIYEDDNWKVLHIKTYEAAKQYGKGSKWCICGNYPGHEAKGQYYFNSYLESDYSGYYIFLNKKPTDEAIDAKYMVCVKKDDPARADIWNQPDHTIDFIPNGPTIKGFPAVSQISIIDGKLISVKNSYNECIIPEGVESIKNRALMNYKGSSIQLPNTVKEIGSGAFMQSHINEMVLPNSVERIGKGILCNCEFLSRVVVGSGVTSIPDLTFAYNESLENVKFLGNVTDISDIAFKGSRGVKIYCDGDNNALMEFGKSHNIDVIDFNTNEIISDRQQG